MRLGPLRSRNYRAVLIGQATSSLGNGLVAVALAFAVLELTGSATDLGIVLTAQFLSQLALFLAGGVVADRISRRTVMIGADLARCASQGLLGALLIAGHPSISVIVLLVVVAGLAGGIFTPAAQGLTPALVDADDLAPANMIQSVVGSATGIIGPLLGGLLVATIGAGWAIAADAATFAVNVGMLLRVRIPLPPREHGASFLSDVRTGWREFRARSWFFSTVVAVAFLNMLAAAYLVLGPVICRRDYGGAVAWGYVTAAGSVGGALGGLAAMRWQPRRPMLATIPLIASFGLVPLAFAGQLPLPVICVADAFGVFGTLTFNSVFYTVVYKVVPENLLSRLSSYDYFFAFLLLPIGSALAGPVSAAVGLDLTLAVIGIACIAGPFAILAIPSVRELTLDPTAGPAPAAAPTAAAGG
jgi:predicted MFS family arabinose efflux permease